MCDYTTWDAAHVASWLEGLTPAFRRYRSKWLEDEVTGDMLPDLDDGTLRDLGVSSSLHRKRILRAVFELMGTEPPAAAPAPAAAAAAGEVSASSSSSSSSSVVGAAKEAKGRGGAEDETAVGRTAEKPGSDDVLEETRGTAAGETKKDEDASPPRKKRARLEEKPSAEGGAWTRPAAPFIDCPICLCDAPSEEAVALASCGHAFCERCLTCYVRDKVKAGEVVPAQLVCPCVDPETCGVAIDPAEVTRCLIDAASRERYERLTLQRYVDAEDDTGCCPTPGCAFSFAWDEDNRKLECPLCGKTFCLVCRVEPWHTGVRCEDYQAEHGTGGDGEDDEKFVAFAKRAKLRQCPKCRFFVEKTDGCDAMHCRCNLVFCYQCGGVRKSGTGFKQCQCPGVADLLRAHEGSQNPNLLEFGDRDQSSDSGEDSD